MIVERELSSFFRRPRRRTPRAAMVLMAGLAATLVFACKSTPGTGSGTQAVTFHGTTPLFAKFGYDTGLVPAASPVQVEFAISAGGEADVDASGKSGGSGSALTVYGTPGSGKLTLSGKFALTGKLKADVTGLTSYDGPLPGLDNVDIEFNQSTPFDPFLIGKKAHVDAAIPAAMLPSSPLPGGIPGTLVLSIEDGSVMSADFSGVCAAFDGKNAHYTGSVTTSGTLKIKPSVVISIPIVGMKSFDIPDISVPIPASTSPVDLGSPAAAEGADSTPTGDAAKQGTCAPVMATGTGGAGGSGTTSTSMSSTDATMTSVTSTVSTGSGGTCDSGTAPDMSACSQCQTCAQAGPCIGPNNDCANDPACGMLVDCLNACAANDTNCSDACNNNAPASAVTENQNYLTCLYCTACPISCDGAGAGCPAQ